MGFSGGAVVKESSCQCRRHKRCGLDPWVRKIPWRKEWQPTPVFLRGKSQGQRSQLGYSSWGHKESGTMSAHIAWHGCRIMSLSVSLYINSISQKIVSTTGRSLAINHYRTTDLWLMIVLLFPSGLHLTGLIGLRGPGIS